MEELVGKTIDDRFRVDSFIAAGGMGAVYRGTQLSVDRPVAIKVIRDQSSAPEQIAIERFFREAQSISQLAHPNIVSLVDFGRDDALTYLVMEFVAGVSLASLIENQYSNPAFVLETLRQIAEALAEAHAKGLVHRDLKPDNILVLAKASGAVQIKVVDFGIARLQEYETISDSGAIVGTPHYMSPEQAQDEELDGRSDLFALGVVAYEMMTGQLPFDASEPLQTMMKICNEPLTKLHDVLENPDGWPAPLCSLVERLLEKSPSARIQSATELIGRLNTIANDFNLPAPRVSEHEPLQEVAGPKLPETAVYPSVTESVVDTRVYPPRRIKTFVMTVLLLAACSFAVVWLALDQPSTDADGAPPEVVKTTEEESLRADSTLVDNANATPIVVDRLDEPVEQNRPASQDEIPKESVATPEPVAKKPERNDDPKPKEQPKSSDEVDTLKEKMKWLKSKGRD